MNDLILEKKLEVTLSIGKARCSLLMAKKSLYSLQMVCGLFPPLTHVQTPIEMYSSFSCMNMTFSFPSHLSVSIQSFRLAALPFRLGLILLFFSIHHLLPQPLIAHTSPSSFCSTSPLLSHIPHQDPLPLPVPPPTPYCLLPDTTLPTSTPASNNTACLTGGF